MSIINLLFYFQKRCQPNKSIWSLITLIQKKIGDETKSEFELNFRFCHIRNRYQNSRVFTWKSGSSLYKKHSLQNKNPSNFDFFLIIRLKRNNHLRPFCHISRGGRHGDLITKKNHGRTRGMGCEQAWRQNHHPAVMTENRTHRHPECHKLSLQQFSSCRIISGTMDGRRKCSGISYNHNRMDREAG